MAECDHADDDDKEEMMKVMMTTMSLIKLFLRKSVMMMINFIKLSL